MTSPAVSQQAILPGTLGALTTDSNSTPTQLIEDWHLSNKLNEVTHQSQLNVQEKDIDPKEHQSSQVEEIKNIEHVKYQQNQSGHQTEHHNISQKQGPSPDSQNSQATEKAPNPFPQESSVYQSQQEKMKNVESKQQGSTQHLSDQQASTSDMTTNPMKRVKSGSVPFTVLIPILRPHLDKDRNMQLDAVFAKLRSNEITKENFLRVIRNIVGDPMLRQAAQKVQSQMAARSAQSEQQTSQQQVPRSSQQVIESHSISQLDSSSSQLERQSQTEGQTTVQLQHFPPSSVHTTQKSTIVPQIDVSAKSSAGGQPALQGHLSVVTNVVKQERDVSVASGQVFNRQQVSQPSSSSSSMYGATATHLSSQMLPRPSGASSIISRKSQAQDLQMRQLTPQGLLPLHQVSSHDGQTSQFTSQLSAQQPQSVSSRQLSSGKELKTSTLSATSFTRQEVSEKAVELEVRPQFSSLQGSLGSTLRADHVSTSHTSIKGEAFEKQAPRVAFSTSTITQLESGMQGRSQVPIPPIPVAAGVGTRTPPKKVSSVGQKKPLETQNSSPSLASKKQKVSGAYHDQSIEQLNDVTAVSGVNLREEEEQLLSAPKEESRASEATRRVAREEEEKLILQKGPLSKKIAEITSKCGIKSISSDVERCLSLSVEERMRGLIGNMIRISRQRVDLEKARHQIVVTSDVRQQILMMSKKAKEEWERKQAEEAERLRKQNDGEGNGGPDADKEKDEASRTKSLKSKEEDDKMRTTAANVAARAAVGGDDMLSKWQLMAEQARQKREGVGDAAAASSPGSNGRAATSTATQKPPQIASRASKDQQGPTKKASSVSATAGSMQKFGRMAAQPKVVRSITSKDVIAVLEREPQMTKSSLIYRLYHGAPTSTATD
ncbi:TBP-associated factor 4 isoform X2 [Wolffia australiana]